MSDANTIRGLAAKWRESAKKAVQLDAENICADELDALADAIEAQDIDTFFLGGGGGFEGGISAARAVSFSFAGMLEMVKAFAEHIIGEKK